MFWSFTGQISYDLKVLQKRWLESSLVNFDQARAKELAKIDALERTYYEAWEGSLVEKETKTAEKTTGGASDRIKAVSRHEHREGNPAFLAGVQWCIEQRCKILGIDQGGTVNVNVSQNNLIMGMTSEEFRALPNEEKIRILKSP